MFFTDVSYSSQTNLEVMGMGIAFGDINKDGLFDFYTTNLNENSLLLNSSNGSFSDISFTSGTQDMLGSMGWGTFFLMQTMMGGLIYITTKQLLVGFIIH